MTDLDSPIVLRGDENTAYRDAAAIFHHGVFYLYVTMIRTEEENRIYSYTALSRSSNLRDWSKPVILTPKGQRLNHSSPGNVIRYGDEWIICLQSYPRPGYKRGAQVRWADQTARIFIMRSPDLVHWSARELPRLQHRLADCRTRHDTARYPPRTKGEQPFIEMTTSRMSENQRVLYNAPALKRYLAG